MELPAGVQLPRFLDLHVDVNKTLIMVDPSGSKTLHDVLVEIIACSSWGEVDEEAETFTLGHGDLARDQPGEGLYTYKSYVDWLYPHAALDDSLLGTPTAKDVISRVNQTRSAKLKRFTATGEPGEAMAPFVQRLLDALAVSPAEAALPGADVLFRDGFHFLLPSFLHAVTWALSKGIELRVTFRTYGQDYPAVIPAWNAWCAAAGHDALSIRVPENIGTFFRDGTTDALVWGTLDAPRLGEPLSAFADPARHRVVEGLCAIDAALYRRESANTVAIVDSWQLWEAQSHDETAAKVHFVDSTSRGESRAIFLDDNIREGSARDAAASGRREGIVDVWERGSMSRLTGAAAIARGFLAPVSPLDAVLDREFFVKAIIACCAL